MTTLADWPDAIHLIGAGGIGTHAMLTLIELGAEEVHVWDDDTVAPHNRPTQFMYNQSDIGQPKVLGMKRFVESQDFDITIIPHERRVDAQTKLTGIVISGVDDLPERKAIWHAVRGTSLIPFYFDGRISDAHVQAFTITPTNRVQVQRYEKWLKLDEQSTDRSCTTRRNPHSALRTAQVLSINLTSFLRGEPVKDIHRVDLRREAEDGPAPAGRSPKEGTLS